MLKIFYACLKSDLRGIIRNRAQWLHPIIFFIIFISLFGIGLGFDTQQLVKVTPAIIWIAFLLTALFTIETMFRADQEEGVLEQMLLSPYPLWWLILAKSIAFWIASCLPLILMMPILGSIMQLSVIETGVLLLSLFVGSPALTFMGVLGAALTVAMPRSGVFLGLLLLPLYVPVLILGESAVVSLLSAEWPIFQIALLGSISTLAITLAPHGCASALKVAMD